MNRAVETDPPPSDGGPLLFFATFLAPPAALWIALTVAIAVKGRADRFGDLLAGLKLLGVVLPGAIWPYFSRSRWAIAVKSGAYGLAVTTASLVYLKMTTTNPQGDDVMPLFWIFAAPFLALGGGTLTTVCGLATIAAFWLRQRPRAAWLERVRQGHHADYRVFHLPPGNETKPLFLRYRNGDLALARLQGAGVEGAPQLEIVARAPWY